MYVKCHMYFHTELREITDLIHKVDCNTCKMQKLKWFFFILCNKAWNKNARLCFVLSMTMI